MTLDIVAISGSLRRYSYNSALLRACQELSGDELSIEIGDIAEVPLYNADLEDFPTAVEQLAQRIRAAYGLLIATPEYNFSVPGVLKNTVDWLSRAQPQPFKGKPVALMGASYGRLGTINAQAHLRHSLMVLDAAVMNQPLVLVATAPEKFEDGAGLVDAETRDYLASFLGAFASWVRAINARD